MRRRLAKPVATEASATTGAVAAEREHEGVKRGTANKRSNTGEELLVDEEMGAGWVTGKITKKDEATVNGVLENKNVHVLCRVCFLTGRDFKCCNRRNDLT